LNCKNNNLIYSTNLNWWNSYFLYLLIVLASLKGVQKISATQKKKLPSTPFVRSLPLPQAGTKK
jgi:hypothetical protein